MRVLIAAGSTAGHINPALAIAGALKAADPTARSTLRAGVRGWVRPCDEGRLSVPSY